MMNKDIEDFRGFQRRSMILGIGKAFFSFILIGKLYYLQIINQSKFGKLSESNRIKIRILYPERGIIFDDSKKKLAQNRIDYQITILKEKKKSIDDYIMNLSKVINFSETDYKDLKKNIKRRNLDDFIIIKRDLTWEELEIFEYYSHYFPFLSINKQKVRSYESNYAFSHVLGYVGYQSKKTNKSFSPELKVGKTGFEKVYNYKLIGTEGIQKVESNSGGKVVRLLDAKKSKSGSNINTYLNKEIQEFGYELIKDKSASIVLIDCKSGGVLSLVSAPSFNINDFSYGIKDETWRSLSNDQLNPLLNKTISGLYSPGSTFKLIAALAIYQDKRFNPNQSFFCNGSVELANHKFHCWKRKGHGMMDLNSAIKESCDCYFYNIANGIDINELAKIARVFAIGKTTGIDLPNESKGIMPDEQWKRKNRSDIWHLGETYNAIIGQGFTLSTPLQIATMTARIASGKMISPKLLKENSTKLFNKINIDPKYFNLVRNSMFKVVNEYKGTAYSSRLKNSKYKMAGKTGTSQVRRISLNERETGVLENKELPYELRDHSIFSGFAPFDDPRYAVSVVVEHHGSGSKYAAPIARDVMDFTLSIKG